MYVTFAHCGKQYRDDQVVLLHKFLPHAQCYRFVHLAVSLHQMSHELVARNPRKSFTLINFPLQTVRQQRIYENMIDRILADVSCRALINGAFPVVLGFLSCGHRRAWGYIVLFLGLLVFRYGLEDILA